MNYTYESQKKVLNYLVQYMPHDMKKFEKLYAIEGTLQKKAVLSIEDILFSDVWSTQEKIFLIKLYGHDKHLEKSPHLKNVYRAPLIDKCIEHKSFTGVQALMHFEVHISLNTIGHVINYITDPGERYRFCQLILNYVQKKAPIHVFRFYGGDFFGLIEVPSLTDRIALYLLYSNEQFETYSSMNAICATNDLDLVKLFLPTVQNIKPLFMFAVNSGNVEMAKLFVEAGADVNYQDLEFKCDNGRRLFKTPIKLAIDNNDLEMVKFLHQVGADLDFVDHSQKMQEYVHNLGRDFEKENHNYKNYWDMHDYIIWTKTPLEYAITLGAASIIDQDLINDTSRKAKDPIEKQIKDRCAIVRYLYDANASFGNGEINFTDLICFAIKSDDLENTKYYFEEALKHGSKLDFIKIIGFIHVPGRIDKYKNAIYSYKTFEDHAKPWFLLCEEYSSKLDSENHHRNVKLMLEKIFNGFAYGYYYYGLYKDIIASFTKKLPEEMLKEIPAVFGVILDHFDEILPLGYDINTIKNGNSIIMREINSGRLTLESLKKLIDYGADINYQDPETGNNALSLAIASLPTYDFDRYRTCFDTQAKALRGTASEYERTKKDLIKEILRLSSKGIVQSDSVLRAVYLKIGSGYPQIIYNELLNELVKRGFSVGDDYVKDSVSFLTHSSSPKFVSSSWDYLSHLYSNFSNMSVGTNVSFPEIEKAENLVYGSKQGNSLFLLIKEHLTRNFVTLKDQIPNPDEVVGSYWCISDSSWKGLTALEKAQKLLIEEIKRYIRYLDYRYILDLIDSFPIIDPDSIIKSGILRAAIDKKDANLCKAFIDRGFTIVEVDKEGFDITSKVYNKEQIAFYAALDPTFSENSAYHSLLAEIGCEDRLASRKRVPKESENPDQL